MLRNARTNAAAVCAFFITIFAPAASGEVMWNQPAFGIYQFGSSWSGGNVPGSNDIAVFGGTFTTANADVQVNLLHNPPALPETRVGGAWVASGNYTFAFLNPDQTFSIDRLVVGGGSSECFESACFSVPNFLPDFSRLSVSVPFSGGSATPYAIIRTEGVDVGSPPFVGETIRPGVLRLDGGTDAEKIGNTNNLVWVNQSTDQFGSTMFIGALGNTGVLEIVRGARWIDTGGAVWIGGGSSRPFGKNYPEFGIGRLVIDGAGSVFEGLNDLFGGTSSYSSLSVGAAAHCAGEIVVTNYGKLLGGDLILGVPGGRGNDWEVLTNRLTVYSNSVAQLAGSVFLNDNRSVLDASKGGVILCTAYADFIEWNPLPNPGTIYVDYSVRGRGILRGHVVSRSFLDPGALYGGTEVGTMTIEGGLEQTDGRISFSLEGLTPDTQHSQLVVRGPATLTDATIEILLTTNYEPSTGETFELIHATGGVINTRPRIRVQQRLPNWHFRPDLAERMSIEGGILRVLSPILLKIDSAISPDQHTLRWPFHASGYQLQQTAVLGAGNDWTNVTNAPTAEGAFWKLVLPSNGGSGFYRLRKP